MFRLIIQNVVTGEEEIWDIPEYMAEAWPKLFNHLFGPAKNAKLVFVETKFPDGSTIKYDY